MVSLVGCGDAAREPGGTDAASTPAEQVSRLADEYVAAWFERFPEAATQRGISGTDHGRVRDNWPAALARWRAREDAWLAKVGAVQAPRLGGNPRGVDYC